MSEPEDPREKWNARYAAKGQELFERAPSEWVAEHRDVIVAHGPGRALDVARGGGRNAFFLAEHGFDVDAVDVSDVAIDGVTAMAERRGLRVTTARADVERTPFPRPPYREDPEAWRAGLVARRPSAGAAPRHGVDSAAS